jgi:ferredoxin--NADP+ reductase
MAQKPLRVVVIGSGPSGFYAAEALLKKPGLEVRVDVLDRLPTPFGLVRGGVAPDHQKIKSVIKAYEKVAAHPGFRFFGNVMLGRDVEVADLRARYDQIVYAVGNESDRRLGIPGEQLEGVHSATAFVGWYNGHPDHRDRNFDLSCERVAVVGVGNVAMDVTRLLCEDPARLAGTDIARHAHEVLEKSSVKEVWLLGRRGPAQAAFSAAEIHEISELTTADIVVRPEELRLDPVSEAALSDPAVKKNIEFLAAQAKRGEGTRPKKVCLRFCVSPVEVLGEGGKVTGLKLERNRLVPNGDGEVKAVGTGEYETLSAGMVLRSVGYRGVPIPGVPFDADAGKIPNASGRVLDASGQVLPGEYVVGWAKRGPTGLIGVNRADSTATVGLMFEDLAAGKVTGASGGGSTLEALLDERKVHYVTFDEWKRLDEHEVDRGTEAKKLREKITRIEEMLQVLGKRR